MIAKTTSKQTPFKNVVLIGFTVLLFFGMSLLLVGCGNNSEEQRIAELEAEVERLQNEQNSDDAPATGDVTDDADNQDQASQNQTTYDNPTVQDFSDRADELISQAEAAEVPSDRDARIDSYFELDSKFNALELEMDTYEDQQEGEYRSGSLTWDDYRSLELQLEQIEERLDTSQDKLENRFGIDDYVIARSVTLSEKIAPLKLFLQKRFASLY